MGILGKLMFWKKRDEFSDIGLGEKENLAFGDEFGSNQQMQGYNQGSLGQQYPNQSYPTQGMGSDISAGQPSRFQQHFQPPRPQQDMNSKDLEIISSKIDAMRAVLENINQRLANLEAIAKGEEETRKRRYY
jgi:hypothetical protein